METTSATAPEAPREEPVPAPPGRLRLRGWRASGVRIFSSASDAPLSRRPTDVVMLILSVLALALLSTAAPGPTVLDSAIAPFVKALPGLFGWFWEISYDLLIGWALLLLVLSLVARGRKRLLLEEVLAGGVAFVGALALGSLAGTEWSASARSVEAAGPPAIYLAVRVAIATAVVVMASPHMSRPIRHVGRWVIGAGACASVALGVTLPIGLAAGFLVGIASAAIVHLIIGSPAGRLTSTQIAAALADLGVEATDVRQAPLEPRGVALALATGADGRSLLVKVYGRDAWDGQLLTSTWNALWHRGETPHIGGSRLQLVEHEAYVTLLAQRGGVPVLPVVAAGLGAEGDALLVTESAGRPLASLRPDEIDDGMLRGAWQTVARLHALGVAHGAIDANHLLVLADGRVALADFGLARSAAPDAALLTDQAQLLVTAALFAGREAAVSAAMSAGGADAVVSILPFLQPAALDRETRRALKERDWEVDDLRALAAQRTGVEPPELERLRRVTWGSIAVIALVGFLAYAIIGAIANIGVQSLIDELKQADPAWLIAALLLSPAIQLPQAFSTIGASIHPVRYGPALMLEYGIQFLALAVPSSAARVALEVRFFERVGVDPGGAVSIGVIDSVCGFVVQILLILIITLSGLASLHFSSASTSTSTSSSSGGSGHPVLILFAVILVLAGIAVLFVPRYRSAIREAVPRFRTSLRSQASAGVVALRVLRSPRHLLLIFSGNLAAQLLQAIVLGLCLHAFGEQVSLAGLILVNTFVSLFAGFMPVPGGMGVAEAGYTAGLAALGVPNSAAMSTALAFRLVTFYLPPIWGSFAMRWMRRNDYV